MLPNQRFEAESHLQGVNGSNLKTLSSLGSFWQNARQNQALAIPACLYSLNNYLKFMMQLYFKPTTAKMLANLKVHAHPCSLAMLSHCSQRLQTARCLFGFM